LQFTRSHKITKSKSHLRLNKWSIRRRWVINFGNLFALVYACLQPTTSATPPTGKRSW